MKLSGFLLAGLCFSSAISVFCAQELKQGSIPALVPASPSREVSSVKPIGSMLLPRKSSSPVVAQSGNFSVPLENGRTLWFLNNIWTGEVKETGEASLWGIIDGAIGFTVSSAPALVPGAMSYVSDENHWPLPVLSPEVSEFVAVRKFWPRAGLAQKNGYFLFYSIMNNFGVGPYDYFRVGQGIAWAQKPEGPYSRIKNKDSDFFWNDTEPAFGSALLTDRDGWVYVYGRYASEPAKYSAALAKVKPEDLKVKEKYLYYSSEVSSQSWTTDINEVSPVFENIAEEFSVSYNNYLKAYLAFYFDTQTDTAVLRTAPAPWGPWDEVKKIITCSKEDYCFSAKEQPGFSAEGGKRVVITMEKKNIPYLYEVIFE